MQGLLGGIIIGYLRFLQEKDPDKLKLLIGAYNNTIKARALEDEDFFDAWTEYLDDGGLLVGEGGLNEQD